MTALINGKTIKAKTFSQIKRLASIEANTNYNIIDTLYIVGLPGFNRPLVCTRTNRKAPNNTIIRGKWK